MAIELLAGLDLGNGYTKTMIQHADPKNTKQVKTDSPVFPSIAAKRYNPGDSAELALSELNDFAKSTLKIIDNADVSFESPMVTDTSRRLFGERALTSGSRVYEQYVIGGQTPKANNQLTGMLGLVVLAAKGLKQAVDLTGKFPEEAIKIEATLALALPIEEFRNTRREYKQRWENNGQPHRVTFHNFEQKISVEVTVKKAYIVQEGQAAQYGLRHSNDALLTEIQKKAVSLYPNGELDKFTGKQIVSAKNTLGIDIGEGTTDFAVFTNGEFNTDASKGIPIGYSEVLQSALKDKQISVGLGLKTIKQISELIHNVDESEELWDNRKEIAEKVVDQNTDAFADSVTQETSMLFESVASSVQVIFVYGGGASPAENALLPKLKELIERRQSQTGSYRPLPIVYLGSGYSRFLNVHGLFEILKNQVAKK